MKIRYYVVDAFTDKIFNGNSAGICVVPSSISDETMQKIAFENNLSETAFIYKNNDMYKLRWFTPFFEINLCGHATLAAAHIIFTCIEPDLSRITFDTMSGLITVEKKKDTYMMSLPIWITQKVDITNEIKACLKFSPKAAYGGRDLFLFMDSENDVKNYVPDYNLLSKLDKWMGIVITAKGSKCDFVSRYFCPELQIEDPVTGSSHSSLVPLWSEILGKKELEAEQLSKRGGKLHCTLTDEHVEISGNAVTFLNGSIEL